MKKLLIRDKTANTRTYRYANKRQITQSLFSFEDTNVRLYNKKGFGKAGWIIATVLYCGIGYELVNPAVDLQTTANAYHVVVTDTLESIEETEEHYNAPLSVDNSPEVSIIKEVAKTPQEAKTSVTGDVCTDYTAKYATEYGVSKNLLDRIVMAESTNNPNAKNPNSTATGCAQWIASSWKSYGTKLWGGVSGKDIRNADHNVELLAWTVSKYGTSPWNASKHNWN